MKTIQSIQCLLLALAVAAATGGCAKDPGADAGQGRVTVNFAAPDIEPLQGAGLQGAPDSKAALDANTTVRIVVFTPGAAPSSMLYLTEKTYYMHDGKLLPCTVDAKGAFVAANPDGELSLPGAWYDFYAVSPALPLAGDHVSIAKSTLDFGMDIAMSVTRNVAITADQQPLSLNQLSRKCARVDFVIQKEAGYSAMTALSVTPGGTGVKLMPMSLPTADLQIGDNDIPQATGTATLSVPAAQFTQADATTAKATSMAFPQSAGTIRFEYDLTYTVSGTATTKTFSGAVGNLTLEKGKRYTVTLTMKESGATLTLTDWAEHTGEQIVIGGSETFYPYIGAGKFVVSKDDKGGLGGLHPRWTEGNPMPTHYETSPLNTLGERIEVCDAPGDGNGTGYVLTLDEARALCTSLKEYGYGKNWRLPTLAELTFILENGTERRFYGLTDPIYPGMLAAFVTGTECDPAGSGVKDGVWLVAIVNLDDNYPYPDYPLYYSVEVRYDDKNSINDYLIRCVRDIE